MASTVARETPAQTVYRLLGSLDQAQLRWLSLHLRTASPEATGPAVAVAVAAAVDPIASIAQAAVSASTNPWAAYAPQTAELAAADRWETRSLSEAPRLFACVEEHGTPAAAGVNRTGFALAEGGWVGLQVNYPFQSAGMLAARPTGVVDPRTGRETQELVDADVPLTDFGLDAIDARLFPPPANDAVGAYAGPRALGRFYATPDSTGTARAVRPFRRILSASAGFRRQIFGGAS